MISFTVLLSNIHIEISEDPKKVHGKERDLVRECEAVLKTEVK